MKVLNLIKNILFVEIARFASFFSKKEKSIWLISESEMQAQENGLELYKWIRENRKDIDAYYILDRKSPCSFKFDNDQNILWLGSFKQTLFLFIASRIISTHGLWMIPNALGIQKKSIRKKIKAKKVMLNHGMCFLKNGKRYYHKNAFALNDHIIATSPKHKSIFTEIYGYNDDEVSITGYPRFDSLIDSSLEQKHPIILYMPTFRDGEQKEDCNFEQTEIYKNIIKIAQDKSLESLLEYNDAKIYIYLHQSIQKHSHLLDVVSHKNIKVIKQGEHSVSELLAMSKILITDYSSVMFDFVYMKKPVISYQFDLEKYLLSREDKPIINLQTDIPAYVVSDHKKLINVLSGKFLDNFTFDDEHKIKTREYFTYNDRKNCERTFLAIKMLD